MKNRIGLNRILGTIHIYPTLAEDISATTHIEQMIQGLGKDPDEILLRADGDDRPAAHATTTYAILAD
jgi:hypothetical protein